MRALNGSSEEQPESASSSEQRLRVLLVDDDAMTRLAVGAALDRAGFDVVFGIDGEEAVALFHTERPDVVPLDVNMPRKDGFEACMEIRNPETRSLVPVVMITGSDDIESVSP